MICAATPPVQRQSGVLTDDIDPGTAHVPGTKHSRCIYKGRPFAIIDITRIDITRIGGQVRGAVEAGLADLLHDICTVHVLATACA